MDLCLYSEQTDVCWACLVLGMSGAAKLSSLEINTGRSQERHTRVSRETDRSVKRDRQECQERQTGVSKETDRSVKRDTQEE